MQAVNAPKFKTKRIRLSFLLLIFLVPTLFLISKYFVISIPVINEQPRLMLSCKNAKFLKGLPLITSEIYDCRYKIVFTGKKFVKYVEITEIGYDWGPLYITSAFVVDGETITRQLSIQDLYLKDLLPSIIIESCTTPSFYSVKPLSNSAGYSTQVLFGPAFLNTCKIGGSLVIEDPGDYSTIDTSNLTYKVKTIDCSNETERRTQCGKYNIDVSGDYTCSDTTVQQDTCFIGKAISQKDFTICEKVISARYKGNCYYQLAVKTGNRGLCENTKGSDYYETCLKDVR